jgi:alcohol dehydrogenase class IV
MFSTAAAWEYEREGSRLIYGRESAGRLGDVLESNGLERALVVTGRHVGANADVMEPIEAGLGDRLVGVFDETTPAKAAETVYDGVETMEGVDPDVLVGVGGGSSLDVARQMGVFGATDRSLADLREEARSRGAVESPAPERPPTPVVVVPTTFAGADVSSGGSIEVLSAEESPTPHPVRTGGSNSPVAMVYDPDLFETTPMSALAGSAMNGFDKGLETPYARGANPVADATAAHGLRHFRDGLVRLGEGETGGEAMERAVVGAILVQVDRRISVIHAFGHGFSRRYDVQQGDVHAIVAPHVLRYVFGKVDGSRRLLAESLGVDTDGSDDEAVAEAVVREVERVRDALDLPTRLRDLTGTRAEHLPDVAAFILEDHSMEQAPAELDATAAELESVLREAW